VLVGGAATLGLALAEIVSLRSVARALARAAKTFRPPARSRTVGNIGRLRANSALKTIDPRTGNPAVVIRTSASKRVTAFTAVCTHAGCIVHYDSGQKLLVCPCHGSVYDPAHGAAVLAGPAPSPLPSLKVAVDPEGNIWLV
jgi:thiosulfate dehydrogenase [quinone] large subunit